MYRGCEDRRMGSVYMYICMYVYICISTQTYIYQRLHFVSLIIWVQACPVLVRAELSDMASSKVAAATRALVSVLLVLSRSYLLVLTVTRESSPEQVLQAYRKVLLKVHPDKGGKKEDAQKLQTAKEAWDKARQAGKSGRPERTADQGTNALVSRRKGYRVRGGLVLLTYQRFTDLQQWHEFVEFVRGSLKKWTVQRWGATLEACETGGLHTHLVLQFRQEVDRTAKSFAFGDLVPNVSVGDYLGEGVNGKRQQLSVDRGFFYVFADKVGTQREADGTPCFEGNHVPVWAKAKRGQSRYPVLGKWCGA